jgi:hypothetical protein
MQFDWVALPTRNRRLRRFLEPAGPPGGDVEGEAHSRPSPPLESRFEPARLDPPSVKAAEVMIDPVCRAIVRQVSQARFATDREIRQANRGPDETLTQALNRVRGIGVLRSLYVLSCGQRGYALTRLEDPAALKDPKIGKLTCHYCGSTFDQEVITEGFSVTELGNSLNAGNRWLTVWTTRILTDLGIPVDAILWNVAEEGEEVDIILEAFERLWILELKDREFGRGDAHPFSYRRTHYRPDHSIVLSTERVSDEAKRIFKEIAAGERRGQFLGSARGTPREPTYIEGLVSAEASLKSLIERESIAYVARCLSPLSELTGADLATLVALQTGG